MNKLIVGSIAISTLLTSLVQAAEIKTDSAIKAVTIYPRSAKVTRVTKVPLDAGNNEIIINQLPINLHVSSLRVSGESAADVSMGSIEIQENIAQDVVQEREKELRQKIELQLESQQEINDAVERYRNQLKYIDKMVMNDYSSQSKRLPTDEQNGIYKNLPLEQWKQAWQTLDSATADAQEKIRLAERSLKNSNRELNKLNRELRLVAVNQRATRSARIQVDAKSATELTLKITYQINGAYWAPVYDADLNTQTGNIELKTLAQISQRTGEDWKNVAVTLSTLRPSAGTQLPHLNTWSIDFAPDFSAYSKDLQVETDEVVLGQLSRKEEKTMITAAKPAMAPAPKRKKKMARVQSEIVSTDFSAEYKVPGTINLESGSKKRRFALTAKTYSSKIQLASAPRLDPRAMILAKTKYDGETPLLAGSLALYRNGSFVGNTRMAQKQSGEEIKLSFGEDDKVKVKFLPDPDKKRKDGLLFGKKKVVERYYKISVTNNHTKPYSISFFDTIPVALNEDIRVKMLGDTPSKTEIDDKKGVLSWERTLAPAKEAKIKYGYSVSYPEEKTIPNL